MVRLVFRPYTQIRRSICTSEPLRASTRVSSGFTLFRHSSPSFGSQQLCSYSNPSEDIRIGRWCAIKLPPTFTFIPRTGFTPKHSHRRQTPWSVFQDGRLKIIMPASLFPQSSGEGSSIATGYNTPPKRSHFPAGLSYSPTPCWPGCPSLISSPSLSTISRTFSLSFQSSFHLSITVLVRYRSLANIQLQMEFTTHLELHSQTTRLFDCILHEAVNTSHGILTLCDVLFQGTSTCAYFKIRLQITTRSLKD